jgi:palmitoyltransferase ZDHHC9/14/18
MCIEGYDHHCPWINNCVGKSNIGRFILFLIMLLLGLSYIVLANVLFLMNKFCTFRF